MDTTASTPPTKSRRLRRWLRCLGWVGVWLITILVLAVAIENWLGARAWRAYVAEAHAAGEHLEPEAIVPPPIPDEENFAAIPLFRPLFDYERAAPGPHDLLGPVTWRDPAGRERLEKRRPFGQVEPQPAGDWHQGQFVDLAVWAKQLAEQDPSAAAPTGSPAAAVLRELGKFDPEMDALRAGASRPRSRFPLRYEEHVSAMVPHIPVLRQFTRIAQVRSLAELSLGDIDAAHRDLLLGFRLAAAVEDEPLLISQLVQFSQLELLMSPLWEGLARQQWSEAQLGAIEVALARVDLITGFQRAIRGERTLFAVQALDATKKQPHLLFTFMRKNDVLGTSATDRALGFLVPKGWLDFNKAYLGHYYDRVIQTADPAAHRFKPDLAAQIEEDVKQEIAAHRQNPHKLIAALILPNLATVQERCAAGQACVDLARVAIALERYRLAHTTLPEKLEALSPQFLSHVPPDVMNGQALHYRHQTSPADSFILYSVGWNGRDDGGAYAWKPDANPARVEWQQGDWPWPTARAANAEPLVTN